MTNLAIAYRKLGKYDIAMNYTRKKINLRQRINDIPGTASGYSSLGIVEISKNNIKQGLEYLEKSIQIADKHECIEIQVESRNWIIIANLLQNNLKTALKVVDEVKTFLAIYSDKN